MQQGGSPLTLIGYFRSTTSYRVRIALNLKAISYGYRAVALLKQEHRRGEFLDINPQGLVPVLQVEGKALLQSPAILEWIEESYPHPSLLPRDALGRQHVRALAAMIGCDIHPVNNLRVLDRLRQEFAADDAAVKRWILHWIATGFDALEAVLRREGTATGYCYGETPTFADCYLIPQVYSACRFGLDMAPYPLINAVDSFCASVPAFAAAHPERQPDAPAKTA